MGVSGEGNVGLAVVGRTFDSERVHDWQVFLSADDNVIAD